LEQNLATFDEAIELQRKATEEEIFLATLCRELPAKANEFLLETEEQNRKLLLADT
jgi:hypothetical protein